MAITRKKINWFEQPPKIYASVQVDSSNIIRQTYDVLTGLYYPDRTLIPLTLTPVIGYILSEIGATVNNAASELINGHWYRIDMSKTKTEITNSATYSIDTTVGSPTYGRLVTKENVIADNPVTYLFEATLNKGGGYKVSCTYSLDTVTIGVNPVLTFDNAEVSLYNPWDTGLARFTINPKLWPETLSATYRWLYFLDGAWIELDSSPQTWAVTKNGDGVVIDRTYMPDEVTLKCIATVDVNGTKTEVEGIVTQSRRLPAYETEIGYLADLVKGTSSINPRAVITTGKGVVDNPGEEVSINWYGEGNDAIASGIQPNIPISALGADMEIGLDVTDNGGYKCLCDNDGAYITDTDGSYFLIK